MRDDAQVVCRQLGFETIVAYFGWAYFHGGSGPIWIGNVNCYGNETSLLQCPYEHDGSGCSHNNDVDNKIYKVRLVDGFSNFSGRVEVFKNGEWGTVCDPNWTWDDAAVVCRQLGFESVVVALDETFFGLGSGPISISDVICYGPETSLLQCFHRHGVDNCLYHTSDAGVVCRVLLLHRSFKITSASTDNKIDKVRLVDGFSNSSGRIEVLFDGEWGTVCHYQWTIAEANVVCKQLGYQSVIVSFRYALLGEGSGVIWMTNVQCTGYETSLSECNYKLFENLACSHHEDVGVLCGGRKTVRSFLGYTYH
ncbi:hypothetical protein HOLleu_32062 [Holothuria leucospilota]|uniref:SRCR domain-containing protein n=1 Tax=Holothuria leucospilota TaxID=206669 RepID=A0A9Q0YQX2_HOLLE|nr:hypothetical protein HOLleu_32062 [Holothuria leucospilota]